MYNLIMSGLIYFAVYYIAQFFWSRNKPLLRVVLYIIIVGLIFTPFRKYLSDHICGDEMLFIVNIILAYNNDVYFAFFKKRAIKGDVLTRDSTIVLFIISVIVQFQIVIHNRHTQVNSGLNDHISFKYNNKLIESNNSDAI